jgi:hypothetical protein
MTPTTFKEVNHTYLPPQGQEATCSPLPVCITQDEEGKTLVISCWQPSAEDRVRIASGGPLYLIVVGAGQPPVKLITEDPFE